MYLTEELLDKLEEWVEKSREEINDMEVLNFAKVREEMEEFIREKLLTLPKEELEETLVDVHGSIMDEELEGAFASLLRSLFTLNPYLYPFFSLWHYSKSLITLTVNRMVEATEEALEEKEEEEPFRLPNFSGFIVSSPDDLQEEEKLFVDPVFFTVIKNSFIVEVIFDYLTHLAPEAFNRLIFRRNSEDRLDLDIIGVWKVAKFILKVWSRLESGKKGAPVASGAKLKKIYPYIAKFIQTNRETIEDIAHAEALLFLESRIWNSKKVKDYVFQEVLIKNLFGGRKIPFEEKDSLPFLSEALLRGMHYLEPEEVVAEFDSDAIYEGLMFLLRNKHQNPEIFSAILEFLEEFSRYPYISRNYNYFNAIALLIFIFVPFVFKGFSKKNLMLAEKVKKHPVEAFSLLIEHVKLPLVEEDEHLNSFFLAILISSLFKLEMYREVLKLLKKIEKREVLFSEFPYVEIIEVMSRFFEKEATREETVKALEEKKSIFNPFLHGELENLVKLIKRKRVEDVAYPLTLLYYYPYSKRLYKEAGINFDYFPKRR